MFRNICILAALSGLLLAATVSAETKKPAPPPPHPPAPATPRPPVKPVPRVGQTQPAPRAATQPAATQSSPATPAATRPAATQPATTQPDEPTPAARKDEQSTPRGTVKLFWKVLVGLAPPNRLTTLIAFEKDEERRLIAAIGDRLAASSEYYNALKAKFGERVAREAADEDMPDFWREVGRELIKQVDTAAEKINGDKATVAVRGDEPWELVFVDGMWRVPFEAWNKEEGWGIRGSYLYDIESETLHARSMRTVVQELQAGKLKTIEQVEEALGRRLDEGEAKLSKKYHLADE